MATNFEKASFDYNQKKAGAFSWVGGYYQGTRKAFTDRFIEGAVVGSGAGLLSGVYYRRISHVPKFAFAWGLGYGAFCASSQWFRFDI